MPKYKHGSGSVYKRGKMWWLSYYVNGKQVWESAKTKDKAEARRILQAKLGQIAEGRYTGPAADRVTFEELVEGVFADYQMNGKKSLDCAERQSGSILSPSSKGGKLKRSLPPTFLPSPQEGKSKEPATAKSTGNCRS
jgi:hypothetical protein